MGLLGNKLKAVADLDNITYVQGPIRFKDPLGVHPHNVNVESIEKLSYALRKNARENTWDFVCDTLDVLSKIKKTQVITSHNSLKDAYEGMSAYIKKEKTSNGLLGRVWRIMSDGGLTQKDSEETTGEVCLPAVKRALKKSAMSASTERNITIH